MDAHASELIQRTGYKTDLVPVDSFSAVQFLAVSLHSSLDKVFQVRLDFFTRLKTKYGPFDVHFIIMQNMDDLLIFEFWQINSLRKRELIERLLA